MMPTANVGEIDGALLNLYPANAPAPVNITPASTTTPIHVLLVIVSLQEPKVASPNIHRSGIAMPVVYQVVLASQSSQRDRQSLPALRRARRAHQRRNR
jgi:hypothetical protein